MITIDLVVLVVVQAEAKQPLGLLVVQRRNLHDSPPERVRRRRTQRRGVPRPYCERPGVTECPELIAQPAKDVVADLGIEQAVHEDHRGNRPREPSNVRQQPSAR